MATQTIKAPRAKRGLRERLDVGSGLTPYFLVLPTIIMILIVVTYPILNSVWLSLLDNPLSPVSQFVGLHNYAVLLSDSTFRDSIATTFTFTIISVALETIFDLGIALLINGTFPGRGLVRASILVPWAFPTIISADIW